jgi:hypothetical protein
LATDPAGLTVKVYPSLAAAMRQAKLTAVFRVWLLCHALDVDRRGVLDVGQVYDTLAGKGSPWRIGGRRRLQQIIATGQGVLWDRDKLKNDRLQLRLYGPARVAVGLGVPRLAGQPVAVPVTDLLEGLHSTNAALFSAVLTLRNDGDGQGRPVTRATLRQLTGTAFSTQRTYAKTAAIRSRPNYVILEGAADTEARQAAHWTHGRGVFVFVDHDGRQGGGRRRAYLARPMPNSYDSPLQLAARGRQRKVNKRLNLVTNGARGNAADVDYSKLYHDNPTEAGKAYNRRPTTDHYWRQCETADGVTVWRYLPKLSRLAMSRGV